MPIELTCQCGRALVLRDELAGKTIRCPQCQGELTVPAAAAAPAEPVLDVLPAADPMAVRAEELPTAIPRPRRRMDLRDPSLAPPKPSAEKGGSGFGSINAGVGGGLLAMVIAVAIFIVGLLLDRIFVFAPIFFVIGLIAFIRGLIKGRSSN